MSTDTRSQPRVASSPRLCRGLEALAIPSGGDRTKRRRCRLGASSIGRQ